MNKAMFLCPMKSTQARTALKPSSPPSRLTIETPQPVPLAAAPCASSKTVVRLMRKIGSKTGVMLQKKEGSSLSGLALTP